MDCVFVFKIAMMDIEYEKKCTKHIYMFNSNIAMYCCILNLII